MRTIRTVVVCMLILGSVIKTYAQEHIMTVGFQYKPVFTSSLVSGDLKPFYNGATELRFKQPSGHTFGMLIRRGYTKTISIETGINTTKRNYRMTITDSAFSGTSGFSTLSYEIPFSILTFIRLGEHAFMNASMGTSLDMYPSDVASKDSYYNHISYRMRLFTPGLLANLGCEYRTEKSGYFYLGASYHRPLQKIYETHVNYLKTSQNPIAIDGYLTGAYITADLRYFFNSEPIKKKERKVREKRKKKLTSGDN